MQTEKHPTKSMTQALKSYGRSLAGALLFALPAIYTMEIWWRGFLASSAELLVLLLVGFGLLVLYQYYTDLHDDGNDGLKGALYESCETLFLAFLVTWALLRTLGLLPPSINTEWLGKIISEGVVVALGFAIGAAQFSQKGGSGKGRGPDDAGGFAATVNQLAFGTMGALLLVAAIAPTEEILVLAMRTGPGVQLGLLIFSFLICLGVFAGVDFRGTEDLDASRIPGGPVGGAIVSFLAAFLSICFLLWVNGEFQQPIALFISQAVILSVPASIGASVGRLLL